MDLLWGLVDLISMWMSFYWNNHKLLFMQSDHALLSWINTDTYNKCDMMCYNMVYK